MREKIKSQIFTNICTIISNNSQVLVQTVFILDYTPVQSAITCSKLTIETLEEVVKYVQS